MCLFSKNHVYFLVTDTNQTYTNYCVWNTPIVSPFGGSLFLKGNTQSYVILTDCMEGRYMDNGIFSL